MVDGHLHVDAGVECSLGWFGRVFCEAVGLKAFDGVGILEGDLFEKGLDPLVDGLVCGRSGGGGLGDCGVGEEGCGYDARRTMTGVLRILMTSSGVTGQYYASWRILAITGCPTGLRRVDRLSSTGSGG